MQTAFESNEACTARRGVRDPVSGYSHLAGCALACIGAAALLARAASLDARVTGVVYGACLVALYAASSAYHLAPSGEVLRRRLRSLDHAAIFLLIAGTCTPVFWRAFDGVARVAMLAGVWVVGALGIAFRLAWPKAPRWLYTAMYVAMGWMFVIQGPRGFHALPAVAMGLVLAGGVTYTAGAVVYALKRPDPFPRVFGFHEIWHLFVLAGSALHYAAVAAIV